MDPFQRAELLQDRALLQKGVILKATQEDFIIFNIISCSSCSPMVLLTFCVCWLILDPPEFRSPPRGLSKQSQVSFHKVQLSLAPDSFSRQWRAPWQAWEILFGCQQEEVEAAWDAQGWPWSSSWPGAQWKCNFPRIPPRAPVLQRISVAISADPNLPWISMKTIAFIAKKYDKCALTLLSPSGCWMNADKLPRFF